ncbi:hypothetical protein A6F68_02389 [Tsuneonella dongtanensis]|uniref:Uncharacterized protein n=1 Tax=Tsuneonella dongtanensis TaxID=692370 RepID=A0A1B2AFL5_9SPHN|nr:hypothetical protein [Tsuneonella dongtanensis]ANY20888.1 hypothetical protein A6F68_02389 [Tsuneonella dongtanensis]
MAVRVALAVGLAAALAACGRTEPEPVTVETPSSSGTATAEATTAPAEKPRPGTAILDAEGVALGRTAATATRFAFGTRRQDVDGAAAAALGSAGEQSANGECGAGPMEFTDIGGLKLNYLDGKLVGWFAEADPKAVTSDGIRPGIRFRDLQATRSASLIEGSTLDGEFEYLAADGQTIYGFVSGTGPEAKVQALYAGVNCFFR